MRNFTYTLSHDNVQIQDSYKIRNKAEMRQIIAVIKEESAQQGYNYQRSNNSWLCEWRAHNLLYDFHFQRERTADVDLSEHEAWWRLCCYPILSFLYGLISGL